MTVIKLIPPPWWRAQCPAHNDPHPGSLTVHNELGMWHCFGCGAGGDMDALIDHMLQRKMP